MFVVDDKEFSDSLKKRKSGETVLYFLRDLLDACFCKDFDYASGVKITY
jgi:hypothetical protein